MGGGGSRGAGGAVGARGAGGVRGAGEDATLTGTVGTAGVLESVVGPMGTIGTEVDPMCFTTCLPTGTETATFWDSF